MSDETTTPAMTAEERIRVRKQMADQAIRLAVSSRWDEAATLNGEYLRLFGEEADAYNRLGKALSELGQISKAREAYHRSLQLEPTNTIARRNLDRLSTMQDSPGQPASQLDTKLFIGETGKSAVASLQAIDADAVVRLDPGDLVELRVQGRAVNVHSVADAYVGMLEPRVGLRLARMMEGGNRYSAAVVTVAGSDIRVMLRETYQHPSLAGTVSFPQGRITDIRGYTRRSLLHEDAPYVEDEEGGDDEETEDWSENGDEAAAPEIALEADEESYD